MCTAGFPEPWTFSLRARRLLAARRDEFDLVHDNQCLGYGIGGMIDDGWPLIATLHHPITVDRQLALSHASNPWQNLTQRRWFGFLRMQVEVARALPRVVTVSESSKTDITAQMGVEAARMTVVPVGVDHTVFSPRPDLEPVPGRIMVTSSSDVPMKGLVPLLEAVAKLRTERDVELVVIGQPRPEGRVAKAIERLGLGPVVRCVTGISDDELADNYGAGPGVGGAVALRGILVAGHRGHGLRRGLGRHDRWRPSRSGGQGRRDRGCSCRPTTLGPWPWPSGDCSTTPTCDAGSGQLGGSGCSGDSPGR